MQQVSSNVYVETGIRGCNPGFVVTSEGVVMIDTPHRPTDAVRWRDEIAKRGQVRYLVLTEHHVDHCTTAYLFEGTVISHRMTLARLTGEYEGVPYEEYVRERAKAIELEGASLLADLYLKLPTIAFSERLTLVLGSHTFELVHLPGHTAGQTAVYIPEERVVFTGDNIFHRVQTWLHESYPHKWLESLKRVAELDVDVIVPGHGEVCDKGYLEEQASFVQEWVEAVREAVAQGFTKEEAQARISFLDRYPMDVGLEDRGPEAQRMSVARLYDLFTAA